MKTAIIKTGFWLDDDVFELNSDTRLVYLCLLTNPQRDLLPAFRCGDRMLSTYTGYSRDLIAICRQQLIDSGRILYEDGYYIFTRQDYVKPSAGRDTSKIYEREYEKLPERVRQIIEDSTLVESTGGSTGTSTGHNNKHINKDNNNNIDKPINAEAQRLAILLQQLCSENFKFLRERSDDEKQKELEQWQEDIEKINRIDGYDYAIIQAVIAWSQDDDFWKKNIRSGSKLRKQFERLLVEAKVEHDNKSSRVVIAGQENDLQTSD